MKKNQSKDDSPLHQTVAEGYEFKVGGKSIAVGYTDQRLTAHGGAAVFWAWLHQTNWRQGLSEALPHRIPTSNNAILPVEKALGFMHGVLLEARKLTHVAYLRRDPVAAELLGIERIASQSVLSRFFAQFGSAAANTECFRSLWRWQLDRLPSRRDGYALDLDSTRLLHEGKHQEGVEVGFTSEGLHPCLHPLLAVIGEAHLVAQLWLRSGDTACNNNVEAFVRELWANLPSHLRLRVVRADSGFYGAQLLDVLEELKARYIVVAKLTTMLKSLIQHDLTWRPTELPGTEVAEYRHQAVGWAQPRRMIFLRHRTAERPDAGGKRLIEVPGYTFQALVTNLPSSVPPLEVWRDYNQRADCENVIKELQQGFGLTGLCLERFWATEAAMALATLTYNLTVLFQRHLGWLTKVTIHSLRFWLFCTPATFSYTAGKRTIRLAVPSKHRDWWSRVWNKLLSPYPNCNAVENRPVFAP
jgi:hypothetical protein